jgi:anti-sigma factor RsiW
MNERGHLSDQTLNEYLDGVLASQALAQVDGHLAACATCERRLREIAELFSTLNGLPEVPLQHDLSTRIVETIRSRSPVARRPSRGSTWRLGMALAAEAVGALALIGLAPLENMLPPAQGALPDLTTSLASSVEEVAVFLSAVVATPDPLGIQALLGRISAPSIPWASVSSLVAVLAGSTLVWLLGNGLLLRRGALTATRRDG